MNGINVAVGEQRGVEIGGLFGFAFERPRARVRRPSRSFPRQHTLDYRQQARRDDAMADGIQMLPIE
jgi:hypothetical protein